MNSLIESRWFPLAMLVASNVFMTLAWYRHLKFKDHQSLTHAILVSWGIAFFEYCIMVPANRWGSAHFSLFQLKILQEVITLTVFLGFAVFYFNTRPQWNHAAAFGCILAAVAFAFLPTGNQ